MTIKLTIKFLLDILEEYKIINKEKKEFFLYKTHYFSDKFVTKKKRVPFVTELVLFMLTFEKIQVEEDFILKLIAGRAGCDFVNIDPLKVDSSLVVNTISLAYGKNNLVLPLTSDKDSLKLAMADPFRMDLIDQLSSTSGKMIEPVVASPNSIFKTVVDIFGFKKSIKQAAKDYQKDSFSSLEQFTKLKESSNLDDKHVINAVDYMLAYAIEQKASDIHIEPKKNETIIRFRIDGILHTIYTFPIEIHLPFTSRLKTMAKMDISEKRRPQDGRIKVQTKEGLDVELRVSTIPVVFGEKVVLRILDSASFIKSLSEIGFVENQYEKWKNAMKKGFGMMLVTGPTGSGKTTTLYSTLKELASGEINIVSVEDPVEVVIDEVNQMSVNTKAGISFSSSLRHILRQDPDVIMVGEIRDKETAENAIQAALTGHLVFSTLHTNDTASTIERLKDLGLEPFLISAVLNGIVAQRLVRKVCPFCSYDRELTEEEKITLNLPVDNVYSVKDSEGCVKCRYTGYKGRTAIIEYLPVTRKMKNIISSNGTAEDIRENALMDGMMTLRDAAIKKLADGITSFEEILKALYYE